MEIFFGAFTTEWEARRATLLHEMSSARRRAAAEEELRRSAGALAGGGGSGSGGGGFRVGGRLPGSGGRSQAAEGFPRRHAGADVSAARAMEVRLHAVARGSQSCVVKMASYGGGSRAGPMLSYVSRSGDLKVETESGRQVSGRDGLAEVREEWQHLFQNRAESRDVAGFHVDIPEKVGATEDEVHEQVRSILRSGFGERRFVYAITQGQGPALSVDGAVVLRDTRGERLTGDQKAADIVQARYDERAAQSHGSAGFSFRGHGNGVEYGTSRVRALVEKHGEVHDERGRLVADEEMAGHLVQKEWRHDLHSRKGRDVMHLIMSARAATDPVAFGGAARDFLAHQFAGFRYVFAMHDPELDPKEQSEGGKRPHIHVHAIIVMRSESGDRIDTSPAVFRAWRALMAEKARDHGIRMEMTDRREFASAPAYWRNQVQPVSREGRTQHIGTSAAAQVRYDDKRQERHMLASSERSVDYAKMAHSAWNKVAETSSDTDVKSYAVSARHYLEKALSVSEDVDRSHLKQDDFLSQYRSNMVTLDRLMMEGESVRELTPAEFEAYEKSVETALFKLERSVGEGDREDLAMVAELARDIVNQRRELVDLYEQRKERADDAEQKPRNAIGPEVEQAGSASEKEGPETDNTIRLTSQAAIARPAATLASVEAPALPGTEKTAARESEGEKENKPAVPHQDEQADNVDRSFPADLVKRYYIQSDRDGTQRVFADFKATRELFQDAGQHLRTKVEELQTVRLMVETAAHRGWSDITVGGTEDFRREAWVEAHARGIAVNGYKPSELDWQEVSRREQTWLRNEIRPADERVAEAGRGTRPAVARSEVSWTEVQNTEKVAATARRSDGQSSKPASVNLRSGVEGTLTEIGERPYKDNEKNEKSPYVVVETNAGSRTLWGVGLPDALARENANIGDRVNLKEAGWETVRKTVIVEVDGKPTRVEKDVERRAWLAEVVERRQNAEVQDRGSESQRTRRDEPSADTVREATKTDPARQHVPRLDQLEREQVEKQEREGDDRER